MCLLYLGVCLRHLPLKRGEESLAPRRRLAFIPERDDLFGKLCQDVKRARLRFQLLTEPTVLRSRR